MFRGCSAAVSRVLGLSFAAQLVRPARPHNKVPLLLAKLISICCGDIRGGAYKQSRDKSLEPNRRGKAWIGRVWLTNVFRGGMRGVRAGYARRGPRVFRAHRNLEGLTERPKIFAFQVWLRIVFRRGMRGFKELGFKLY